MGVLDAIGEFKAESGSVSSSPFFNRDVSASLEDEDDDEYEEEWPATAGSLSIPTSHLSPLTSHFSPLTSHLSLLTSHLSPLPLTSHLSPLTSHLSPLIP